ncbi:MAG: hypothetical protein Q8K60_05085 [Parachlamydiaceae bacterium]|nr:hypothetical protein [Parachlamydiaceae bacterium]
MPKNSLSKPLPFWVFVKKMTRNLFIGLLIIFFALSFGMIGYHIFEKMSWTDAYVNAAMILSGMGPVSELHTEAGKLFAGTYALFSGIVFLIMIAVIFAPVVHHYLHKFHMKDE